MRGGGHAEGIGRRLFLAIEDRVESGRAHSFYREELQGLSKARIYTRYVVRPGPPVAGFFGIRERQVFERTTIPASCSTRPAPGK